MAKITANNITAGTITQNKFITTISSNLTNANAANATANTAATTAQNAFNTANTVAGSSIPSSFLISSLTITDASFNATADTSIATTGGYCIISGSGFLANSNVFFGAADIAFPVTQATVSFINSTTLRVTVPALSVGNYIPYVVNFNGATAVRASTLSVIQPANMFGWGRQSNFGELIDGTKIDRSSPVQVGGGAGNWGMVTSVGEFAMATKTDGTLWTWGYCHNGICGLNRGHTGYVSSPVQVGTNTNWSKVRILQVGGGGVGGACFGIKTDGTLWAWGSNTRGILGLNNTTFRSSPTQVGTDANWSDLRLQYGDGTDLTSMFAIKTNNTLWTWGKNARGQLGLNDRVERSSPTQVGTDTTWRIGAANSNESYGIKTNNTLWCWGVNVPGAGGNERSSPVQVGAGTDWSTIRCGQGGAVIVLKTNGTLWAMGQNNNYNGELGLNTTTNPAANSPVQVGTNTNWSTINSGVATTGATKTDGTLWMWGRNNGGQLGTNDRVYRSSPTQVGTRTGWSFANTELMAGNLTITTRP
ncbi:hypothetical protein EBU71_04110 [bacterium]|nr:hypothetical protein [Candidatus Elulimicrobium humile]